MKILPVTQLSNIFTSGSLFRLDAKYVASFFFCFFFDNQQLVVLKCGKHLSCSINHPGPVENVMGIFHYFLKPGKLTLCIQKSHLNAYYTPVDYCAAHSDKTV